MQRWKQQRQEKRQQITCGLNEKIPQHLPHHHYISSGQPQLSELKERVYHLYVALRGKVMSENLDFGKDGRPRFYISRFSLLLCYQALLTTSATAVMLYACLWGRAITHWTCWKDFMFFSSSSEPHSNPWILLLFPFFLLSFLFYFAHLFSNSFRVRFSFLSTTHQLTQSRRISAEKLTFSQPSNIL